MNREMSTEEGKQRIGDKVAVDRGPRKRGQGERIRNWDNETWIWIQGTEKGE
jgi:hypothetical protein